MTNRDFPPPPDLASPPWCNLPWGQAGLRPCDVDVLATGEDCGRWGAVLIGRVLGTAQFVALYTAGIVVRKDSVETLVVRFPQATLAQLACHAHTPLVQIVERTQASLIMEALATSQEERDLECLLRRRQKSR